MSVKNKLLFTGAFILLFAGRLAIAGTGYLEDIDEWLYTWIHRHFVEFGQLGTFANCMSRMKAQPPEILIRLAEYISVLPLATFLGKQPLHPDVLYFIGIYNIVVSLLILYVFYRILLKLNFGFGLSLAGVILLGTLFNYNMYTRHILPYDHALLFQLMAFNLLLRNDLNPRAILLAGLLSAIGLTTYMGCFMFTFINCGYLVVSSYKKPKVALKRTLLLVLPYFALILSYEVYTRIFNISYINLVTDYYHTVAGEGSCDEGIYFVFLYFYLVEKWWGMALLLLFFAGSYLLFTQSDSQKIKWVLLLGVISYISYGIYVYVFKSMVFEGRILHLYYPFIITGALVFLQRQRLFNTHVLTLAAVLFAFINYGFVVKDFNRIGYPRNAIYKYHLFEEKDSVSFAGYEEMACPVRYLRKYRPYKLCIDSAGPGILAPGNYVLVNLGFMAHDPDSAIHIYPSYIVKGKDSVVFEQLHFQSHPAYTLEYCSRAGRNIFINKQLKIRVIKTNMR